VYRTTETILDIRIEVQTSLKTALIRLRLCEALPRQSCQSVGPSRNPSADFWPRRIWLPPLHIVGNRFPFSNQFNSVWITNVSRAQFPTD